MQLITQEMQTKVIFVWQVLFTTSKVYRLVYSAARTLNNIGISIESRVVTVLFDSNGVSLELR